MIKIRKFNKIFISTVWQRVIVHLNQRIPPVENPGPGHRKLPDVVQATPVQTPSKQGDFSVFLPPLSWMIWGLVTTWATWGWGQACVICIIGAFGLYTGYDR